MKLALAGVVAGAFALSAGAAPASAAVYPVVCDGDDCAPLPSLPIGTSVAGVNLHDLRASDACAVLPGGLQIPEADIDVCKREQPTPVSERWSVVRIGSGTGKLELVDRQGLSGRHFGSSITLEAGTLQLGVAVGD